MNNQWVTPGGDPIDSDWAPPSNPMPPSNDWNDASGCNASSGPAIVDGITITGVPAIIVAPYAWGITLNDGAAPPNFSIDHYDATGALIERPIAIDGVSGDVTLTHDPTQELGAATKRYVDENAAGIEEAPIDNTTYGRDNGTWVPLPQTYLPEAPNTTQLYGRFNSIWALVPIQADAPNDGGTYSRQNGAWTPAVVGGPYLPLTGGTMTGPLYMQGSNMLALNSPLASGQSAILGPEIGAQSLAIDARRLHHGGIEQRRVELQSCSVLDHGASTRHVVVDRPGGWRDDVQRLGRHRPGQSGCQWAFDPRQPEQPGDLWWRGWRCALDQRFGRSFLGGSFGGRWWRHS